MKNEYGGSHIAFQLSLRCEQWKEMIAMKDRSTLTRTLRPISLHHQPLSLPFSQSPPHTISQSPLQPFSPILPTRKGEIRLSYGCPKTGAHQYKIRRLWRFISP